MCADHLLWKNLKSRELLGCRIFTVREILRQAPDGREVPFVRVDAPNWVTIIPEFAQEGEMPEFLVVRQYRHGSGRLSLEFPAGTVEPGELPGATAYRELLEETGYAAQELKAIGQVNPNPAFMSNTSTTFLATNLKQMGDPQLDEHEYLDHQIVSFRELSASIGHPPYDSAIMVQAWFWYLKHSRGI